MSEHWQQNNKNTVLWPVGNCQVPNRKQTNTAQSVGISFIALVVSRCLVHCFASYLASGIVWHILNRLAAPAGLTERLYHVFLLSLRLIILLRDLQLL